MKYLLNRKISNAISMIVVIVFIMGCCMVYAQDPTGHISDMEQDLFNAMIELSPCTDKNHQLANYIETFQTHVTQTCERGGMLQIIDRNGEPVLFYCSRAFEL